MESTLCPDLDELMGFTLGRLSGPAFGRIELHVAGCISCQARLETLDAARDPLLIHLRQTDQEDRLGPVPEDLIEAARALAPAVVRGMRGVAHAGEAWPTDHVRQIGKYELVAELGAGSFGQVFRARDTELDRTVAIKVPRACSLVSREDVDRFMREARSAAQLKHPGIVMLYGTGQADDGTCYLVSEFVEGATLADRLRDQPDHRMAPRRSAELVAELADALAYAHRSGVIHRDLKPSNIMIDSEGRPHVMDFGLAKREADEVRVTLEGQVLGTPAYMSPEQARGEGRAVDGRSDIYSLGVMLYELLTGSLPFRGNRRMLMLKLLDEEPTPPRRLHDRIPRDLETICLKAMAKKPGERYARAEDLADDLRRFLRSEPIRGRPVPMHERLWRWCRRNPVAAGLLLAVSLGSTAGLWHLFRLSAYLVRTSALDSAAMQAEMLEKVNALYSSEIAERLGHQGVEVAPDYATKPWAIPPPATFLTASGNAISESESGMQVRHYSEHPFRTRSDGGPRDEFERQAIERLREAPDQPYFRFVDDFQGRPALRYATARRMQVSCVACHNSHPDSPKTDWQVGDVRGVLEIIRPLDRDIERARSGLRETFLLMLLLTGVLLVTAILVLVAGRPHH